MDICVVGAGYVGLVTSLSLAYLQNKVTVVEVDKEKLTSLQAGTVPFYEPGVEELLKTCTTSGQLSFTNNIDQAVKSSELIFIAVGTPSLPSGEPDMSYVVTVAKTIGAALDSSKKRIIINKSTVPVGSGNWVEMLVNQGIQSVTTVPARASTKADTADFSIVSNPEFLREGSALHDTFYPDRIVIGSSDSAALNLMHQLYKPLLEQSFTPPVFAPRPKDFSSVPFVTTDLASAEMIKYSANAFLAMKVSFANEIANLCEKVGADIKQVSYGIGLDKRIGTAFLNAGIGWGGSCFGKDINALIEVAREYHCSTSLLESTLVVNKKQRQAIITKLQTELKIIKGRTIGLLGLSFKPNTDDLRDAPSLTIAEHLIKMGSCVRAYDPISMPNCAKIYADLPIVYCKNVQELAQAADALLLVTEWDDFLKINWKDINKLMRTPLIIDGRNFLEKNVLMSAGFTYRGIGR